MHLSPTSKLGYLSFNVDEQMWSLFFGFFVYLNVAFKHLKPYHGGVCL